MQTHAHTQAPKHKVIYAHIRACAHSGAPHTLRAMDKAFLLTPSQTKQQVLWRRLPRHLWKAQRECQCLYNCAVLSKLL